MPVCTLCKRAILAPHLLGHLRSSHSVIIPDSVVQACIRTYGLAKHPNQVHLPTFPCKPLAGLEIIQGFACDFPGCKNATASLGTLRKKCAATAHGSKHINHEAFLQELYLGSPQYHRVLTVAPPAEGSLLEAWVSSRPPRPVFTVREDRDIPPWLRRLGWIKRVGKLDVRVGASIRQNCNAPASDHPWGVLSDAILEYLSLAGRVGEEGPRWVSIKIKAKTE